MAEMDAIRESVARRDLPTIIATFFEPSTTSLRPGFRRETELWDFKRGLPGLRGENDCAWAEVAADLAALHNASGGIIFFGITDDTFAFVGTRDVVDARRFNDKVRRYLGDSVWIEFAREFIQIDQRYLGIAVVPARGVNPLRFRSDAPPRPSGDRLFRAGDLAIRDNDQTRVFHGSDADAYLAKHRLPAPDAQFLVKNEHARILRPDWNEFVERDELCIAVRQGIRDDRTYVTSLTGVGGVGKTALACWAVIEAYHEHLFDLFVSVSAKDRTLTEAGILPVARSLTSFEDLLNETLQVLGFSEYCSAPIEERERVVRQLLPEAKMLLFVDNLETVEDRRVVQFIETLPKPTKAITTSRTTSIRRAAFPLSVGPLTAPEAIKFFELHANRRGKQGLLKARPAEKERIVNGCSSFPLAIEWVLGKSSDIESALRRAQDLAESGARDEELLEFCFRRVQAELSAEARGALEALAVFEKPQVLEAIGAATGHSLEISDAATAELESVSLVEKVWDEQMHDFAFRMLPLTRRFAYRELQRHLGEENRVRARLTAWFEGRDVPAESRALITAIRLGKRDPDAALVDAAIGFRQQGRIDEAEKYFRQAIDRNPKSWRAHREYAELLRDRKEIGSALEHYKVSATNAPNHGADRALVSREYGMLLRHSGLPNAISEAAKQFEIAIGETPNDPIVAHALSVCYVKMNHFMKAQPLLERLIQSRSPETRARSYDLLETCYAKSNETLKLSQLRDGRGADEEAAAASTDSKRSVKTSVRPLIPRGARRDDRRPRGWRKKR